MASEGRYFSSNKIKRLSNGLLVFCFFYYPPHNHSLTTIYAMTRSNFSRLGVGGLHLQAIHSSRGRMWQKSTQEHSLDGCRVDSRDETVVVVARRRS